ncbi:MAG: UDP-N-acetylmuramate--L-alanine ligase [Actinomycetota bacterium]|nr:UDP-N-acetylmuramate--L-alanine ligase [Actinomycetota bacterium]
MSGLPVSGLPVSGLPDYVPPPGSIPTLDVPDLEPLRRIHLIGIGGAGMSGIARLLLARGFTVSGSDLKESRGLEDLRAGGATVFVGHRADQLERPVSPDAVVVSSAIPEQNPELVEARRCGIPVLARAQVLAALMRGSRTIAVSGTHGKTTTTSMISVILDRAGLDPTFVIGGDLNESGSGARHGGGAWFVAESDESDGSFLLLHPEVAVATNVEEDHLDFYRDGTQIRSAFARFLRQSKHAVVCGDDPGIAEALRAAGGVSAETYGVGQGNTARLVVESDGSGALGTMELDGSRVELRLRVPGVHNLLNACGAVLAARVAGVAPEQAAEALRSFSGVRRRFEFRGVGRGAEFVDDYAHHPTEVAATLAATPPGYRRVVAVFQPHRYTRTAAMWRELGESLERADLVVVTDVYGAGETPIPGVTGKLVVEALTEALPSRRVVYLPRRSDVAPFLAHEVRPGDLVLTLGAGDVTMVAEETLERILGTA